MKQSTKAMILATRFVYQGYSKSEAMQKAWTLVKLPAIETKVSGVTFEKRQKAIEHLKRYSMDDIGISLERDKGNLYDKNAVAVIASVTGRGSYCMGFLPKPLGNLLSPILDKGEHIRSNLKEIAGGFSSNAKYGLVIAVSI